ncbi:phosphotransferase family protein [Maricurvus nonylphenolicus]|uniref:phosphotransferase family protein n=1 Tax=Maricurvus nonylphenolicus TaxID=1008307 RepID=UPI0036F301EA
MVNQIEGKASNKENHHLDVDRLGLYLEAHIDGFKGPLTAKKFSGGQSNPTFLLTAESGHYVLRRQPPGKLLKSAHAVDREYRVLKALADTAVPVARAYHLCEDPDVIDSMFYVMSYEEGQIFWDPALPELAPAQRADYFDEMIRMLAAMHNVDVDTVGLGNYGRPGNYFERQIGLWTMQYRSSETQHVQVMEELITWLSDNCPADDGQVSLVHGDYRMDNVIFAQGKARGLAVLDWELSTLGHPLADLAFFCACMRLPNQSPVPGLTGIDRDALGIPSEEEMVSYYCKLRSIDAIDNWHFYIAFSFFRLAALAQGILKRALDGSASSDKAMVVGAEPLAAMAMSVIHSEGK